MPFNISIPFYAFRLHLHAGGSALTAMTDKDVLRIGQSLPVFAGQYAELLQRQVLNKGQYNHLLDEYREGDFFKDAIRVAFPAARDGISFPAFSLTFELFYNERNDGFWGVIPALGLEAYARKYDKLIERLEDAIRLDFVRNRRLQAVQDILSTIWFAAVELNQMTLDLQIPGLLASDDDEAESQEALLPLAAKVLKIDRPVVYGRDQELDRISRILKGKFGRNLLLVGPSGVGKTALVWETARQMKQRKIKGQIWETTASTLIKELMRDTGWQENLALLCRELTGSRDLLFVRNLMELFEVGKSEGNDVSMAEFLRSYLDRGEVHLISECSAEELARIQLRSPNFLRLFHTIHLEEPRENLEEIILKKVGDMARLQSVEIKTEAVRELIRLNKRYTPYSGLPGKPIRFLETILLQRGKSPQGAIGRSEIIRYFCEETGLPLFMVDPTLPMSSPKIKDKFDRQVFGQREAVAGVIDMLASVKAALTRTGKPIASFLFAGPTGVGKTELAKVLAEFMFSNRERMVRFDMSEFSSPYDVLRLLGGHYTNDGLLTSAVRQEPFCVLLFDEIEKAHPNFYDLLLQILSEGRLTDGSGQLVNFCSTIIIMTSNIGADNLQGGRISFQRTDSEADVVQHFLSAVQKHFRPELVNRIDQIVAFAPLSVETVRHIVDREIDLIKQREGIRFRKMDLRIAPAVYDFLARTGYHPKYGARHLQRTIQDQLIAPLARELNVHDVDDQLIVQLGLHGDQVEIHIESDPLGLDLLLEELEKTRQSDHASDLRRQITRFQEGHSYVRLLSELDIAEQRKRKEKRAFWDDQIRADRYARLLAARQSVQGHRTRIEDLEAELNLSCLSLAVYHPAILEKIQAWEADFLQMKKDLLVFMEPQYNRCYFTIFGHPILPILQFYLQLFRAKSYECTAHAIWFQEAYYQQITALNEEKRAEDGYVAQSPYLKTEVASLAEPISFLPPEGGGKMYGVQLSVNGPAAYLFLLPENGFQQWKIAAQQDHIYAVTVEHSPQPVLDNIHRADYYKRKPIFRTLRQQAVKDSFFDLKRELKLADWPAFHREKLEEHFNNNLDRYVF